MSYYPINLIANKPTLVQVSGSVILVDDLGAAPGLDIMPSYGGRDLPNMPNRKKAFKFSEPFDAVTLTAPVNCTVALFLSKNDVSLGFADGSLVNVSGQVTISNTDAARVPVDLNGGTVNVTASNVAIANNLTQITHMTANVGQAAVEVIHDPLAKRLRFRNSHATAIVALGAANVSLANAVIQLKPGDIWIEDDAPGADWFAISDTANVSLQMMELK